MTTRSNDLYLFGPYPPPYGGVSIYVYQISEYFKQEEIPFVLKRFQSSEIYDDPVFPTFTSVLKHFWRMSSKTTCVDSSSFFIEYPHKRAIYAWLLLKKLRRFRWVKTILNGPLVTRYANEFTPEQRVLVQKTIRHVDEFVVVSQELKDWLVKEGVTQPVHVIPCLLPEFPYHNTEVSKEFLAVRNKYEKLVSSVGTFVPNYGWIHIADGVEALREQLNLDIGLLLLDGAFSSDSEYRNAVLKNRDWITTFSEVPHPQMREIFRKSDVFVRGPKVEGYGISKVEALWSSLPVVATKTGETRGMMLFDFGDSESLINQLKQALLDPPIDDIQTWQIRFREEADGNLDQLMQVIFRD